MNNRVIRNLLKQKAVYWGNPSNDGYGGYTYDDPVEISVRWVDKQEKFINRNAEEQVSQAVVIVDRDLDVGGKLALVKLADLSSSGLPENEESFEIKSFMKAPDSRGRHYIRKVWL